MKACLLALELKVEVAIDYIKQLLTVHLSPATEEEFKKLSNHSDPAIRNKVWEIRRTIHRSRVPHLRIETLGGFEYFIGILSSRKGMGSTAAKTTFKDILSQGTASIPKNSHEPLAEKKPKRAENNTLLQQLRTSLKKYLHEFGSSYILHDNQTLLDQELCQVDINQFLTLIKKGEEMEKKGEEKKGLSFFTEALELYKGDFIEEDFYSPWADNKREELRNKYIGYFITAISTSRVHS
jgi:hypothetical protein